MNKILNPFEYLSIAKAWLWGVVGTAFSVALVLLTAEIDGSSSQLVWIFSTNLLLWFPLATLLYVAALIFSPSRIRAADIYATSLFALLPTIVCFGISNGISYLLGQFDFEPRSVAEIMVHATYLLLVIILSVTMVWSMIWGCVAYSVSANIKGWSGVVIFVSGYVLVSVANQLMVEYL
ncbi:MAG: hypothetical protein RRY33_01295 [Alistipes sp.]